MEPTSRCCDIKSPLEPCLGAVTLKVKSPLKPGCIWGITVRIGAFALSSFSATETDFGGKIC